MRAFSRTSHFSLSRSSVCIGRVHKTTISLTLSVTPFNPQVLLRSSTVALRSYKSSYRTTQKRNKKTISSIQGNSEKNTYTLTHTNIQIYILTNLMCIWYLLRFSAWNKKNNENINEFVTFT
jgi:hypothetical protein